MQIIGINRWHLGFGALTGSIYYLSHPSNRNELQNYLYHNLINIFSTIGFVNLLIIATICVLRFTKYNACFFNGVSIINSLWISSIFSIIFICLRLISIFKSILSFLRSVIKNRKFSKLDLKIKDFILSKKLIDQMNNRCIICLDDLLLLDAKEAEGNTIILDCKHIFHVDCLKEWYLRMGNCPYCRQSA